MTTHNVHRRDVLKGMGAIAASSVTGACTAPPPVVPGDIEHIVIVTMENRSFDHYFAALNWEEGRNILAPPTNWSNPNGSGADIPVFHSEKHCVSPDPPHSWGTSRMQFEDGTCKGFIKTMIARHGSSGYDPNIVMGYHNRAQLPVCYGLADHYVLCQRWFSSQMSSTWPNRMYAHAAQNLGLFGNDFPPNAIFYDMPTIWNQLSEANVEWFYYHSDLPFVALLKDIDNERVRRIDSFFWDCQNDTLPAVCMVEPAFSFNDDHPPHAPILGQVFLSTIHNALAQSPAWDKTLLLITYDEHGGFFDHVPPPIVPDNYADRGFGQLGFRVPSLVCGPWVKSGHIDDIQRDHTSPLAHIQEKFGFDPLTLRDAAAEGFEDCLDLKAMEAGTPLEPANLPAIELTEEEIDNLCNEDNRRSGYLTGQTELETFLDAIDHPIWRKQRGVLPEMRRFQIQQAIDLGALVIR